MKPFLRKLSLQSSVILFIIFFSHGGHAQVNYVTNGSFEMTYTCSYNSFNLKNVVGWNSADSLNNVFGGVYTNTCQPWGCCTVPLNSFSYQFPRSGSAYILTQLFSPNSPPERGYLKNRLKSKLKSGAKYCAKLYLNSAHNCLYSIAGIGMYFGGEEVDTFSNPNGPMPNIVPQVEFSAVLFDTLNWIPLTGTFVATGAEKYLVIGCFKSNSAVNFTVTNPGWPAWAGYNIDDVSCIEFDEKFAGRDTTVWPGDSLFVGKTNTDSWIDAKFTWFKLPGTLSMDSTTGFWVKPAGTESYVVKQEICGYTIWDTIVIGIKEDDVWLAEHKADFLKVFPVPAKEYIELRTEVPQWYKGLSSYVIIDNMGQEMLKGELDFSKGRFFIDISSLKNGTYTLQLYGDTTQKIVKRIVKSG